MNFYFVLKSTEFVKPEKNFGNLIYLILLCISKFFKDEYKSTSGIKGNSFAHGTKQPVYVAKRLDWHHGRHLFAIGCCCSLLCDFQNEFRQGNYSAGS